jgi:hypothetical protein
MLPDRLTVFFSAWANDLRCNASCIRNMFITDPTRPATKRTSNTSTLDSLKLASST